MSYQCFSMMLSMGIMAVQSLWGPIMLSLLLFYLVLFPIFKNTSFLWYSWNLQSLDHSNGWFRNLDSFIIITIIITRHRNETLALELGEVFSLNVVCLLNSLTLLPVHGLYSIRIRWRKDEVLCADHSPRIFPTYLTMLWEWWKTINMSYHPRISPCVHRFCFSFRGHTKTKICQYFRYIRYI